MVNVHVSHLTLNQAVDGTCRLKFTVWYKFKKKKEKLKLNINSNSY